MSSDQKKKESDFYLRVAYFMSIAFTSTLVGFSLTVNRLRKNTPESIDAVLYEEGAALARKALMKGTIYSLVGFGCFTFTSYHLFGKHWIRNFNARANRSDAHDIQYLQSILGTELTDQSKEATNNSGPISSRQLDDDTTNS